MADGKQYLFQSTRPVWGATTAMNCVKDVHIISIHAPRVGRDVFASEQKRLQGNFNPRAPCGARQRFSLLVSSFSNFNPRAPCGARPISEGGGAAATRFQSTRPVWGATNIVRALALDVEISIHAPRVGRDCRITAGFRLPPYFNPRAPCGARLIRTPKPSTFSRFQSTRPVWGATRRGI